MKSQNNLTEKMKKSFSENFPSHNEESTFFIIYFYKKI